MAGSADAGTYRFDRFVLDVGRGVLMVDGAERALRPKTFALLRHFVENADRLIDRDEIMQAVWPGIFVTDDSIAQCISDLRRALEDPQQRLLRTLPRRGYRFIGPIRAEDRPTVPSPPPAPEVADDTGVPPDLSPAPRTTTTQQAEPERRQVTIASCELIWPSGPDLDPEDLRDVTGAYWQCVADTMGAGEGISGQHIGNAALAYFGYPLAHENDAEQAVQSALDLCAAVKRLGANSGLELRCRVGIATGLVIVNDTIDSGEARMRHIVGAAATLAGRLQSFAEPDMVVIDLTTRRIIGDLFEYGDLGAIGVTGIGAPEPTWKVLHRSAVASRFEALRGSTLSPMVGRDEEIDLLLRRWARAKGGDGQIVLISGEPGIGKSRIVAELDERLHDEPHFRLRYFCSPDHQDSALFPFVDQFARASGFARDDSPGVRLHKLEALLNPAGPSEEDVAFVGDLLSLPAAAHHKLPGLSPRRKKERTFEALIRQLEGLAHRQPVKIVFEDAHWIDPTSRELLDLTIERARGLPVLLIVTFRPEFVPPWAGQSQVTMLALNRLDRRDRTAMVEQIPGGKALPKEVVAQIIDRADGVPLFVEEMTRAVLEAGVGRGQGTARSLPSAGLGVPATLQASLMARFDRLGATAKRVAQIGAAIGREFSYELATLVAEFPDEMLQEALQRLVEAGLAFQRGMPPAANYIFKHALVQDTAYGMLLRGPRQQLHARIATALEAHFPDRVVREPELLARHFSEARQPDRALGYWLDAGRRAAERSANLEAISHLTKALDALKLLPEGAERDRWELTLNITIGTPLMAVHGFAGAETGAAFERARSLGQKLGDTSALFATLIGQHAFHFVGGDHQQMRTLAAEARRTADETRDEKLELVAYRIEGLNAFHFGNFEAARVAFETILRTYDPGRHRPPPIHYIHDLQYPALSFLPVIYWILGYPDRARDGQEPALAYTSELNQPTIAAHLRIYAGAALDVFLLNVAEVRTYADAIVELADRHDLMRYFRLSGQILKGWAMARQGEAETGLELMRQSATERRATGTSAWQIAYLCMLAETYLRHGRAEEGLADIAEAMELMQRSNDHIWEAELARIEGGLRKLRGASADEIEGHFQRALAVARRQNAKSFELRAATSLARLWSEQGRRVEARDLLAAVHSWFTEGIDTADMKDAAALLDELA